MFLYFLYGELNNGIYIIYLLLYCVCWLTRFISFERNTSMAMVVIGNILIIYHSFDHAIWDLLILTVMMMIAQLSRIYRGFNMKLKTNFCDRFYNLSPRIVIYDLDGTIIDSSHRIKLHDNGSLDLKHWKQNCTREQNL